MRLNPGLIRTNEAIKSGMWSMQANKSSDPTCDFTLK